MCVDIVCKDVFHGWLLIWTEDGGKERVGIQFSFHWATLFVNILIVM